MEKLGELRKEFMTDLVRLVAGIGLAGIISFSNSGCCTSARGVYTIPDYCRRDYKKAVEQASSEHYIKYKGENFCRTRDRWKIHRKIGEKNSVLYILIRNGQKEIVSLDEIKEAYPKATELRNGIFDF